MSQAYVSKALRDRVAAQARYRCGYCLTREAVVGSPMEIDHLIPEVLGGPTEEDNLWLACSACNEAKGSRMAAPDVASGEVVRLFNPRRQSWNEHFAWSEEGDLIIGLTPTGRATVQALKLNRPTLVRARQAWVSVGWHPPLD
jgi:hypothetical protein